MPDALRLPLVQASCGRKPTKSRVRRGRCRVRFRVTSALSISPPGPSLTLSAVIPII
jgi:hypothetical protein